MSDIINTLALIGLSLASLAAIGSFWIRRARERTTPTEVSPPRLGRYHRPRRSRAGHTRARGCGLRLSRPPRAP